MKARKRNDDPEGQPETNGQETVDQDLHALMESVQRVSDERDQLRDQMLRTMADFQNFRRRQEDQRKQLEQFATERLVTALLPVLDNFERALSSLDKGATMDSVAEGLRAVDRQFRQVLESQGVARIPAVGHPFDPEAHEALGVAPSEEHEENTVIDELEPGYRMGEKVIRPARVRVSKKP